MEFGVKEITGAINMLERMNASGQLLDKTELVQAYKMRGLLFMQTEHPSEAMEDYNKAIGILEDMQQNSEQVDDNAKAEVYASRGILSFMTGQLDIALRDIDNATRIMESLKKNGLPVNEDIWEQLRWIKASLPTFAGADNSESIDFFDEQILGAERFKNSGQAYDKAELAENYYRAALNHMQNDDKHEAIANFTKCIEGYLDIGASQISDDNMRTLSSAYMCRGGMLYRIDEDEKALDDYNKAVAIEEQFQKRGVEYSSFDALDVIRLYNERAGVLEYLEEHQKAIDDYITSLRLNKTVFESFSDSQEDYYLCLKELLDCLPKVNASQMRLNEILQEFLFPMVQVPKTEEAIEAQKGILESLR